LFVVGSLLNSLVPVYLVRLDGLFYFIYRYDPYDKKFTEEFYDHVQMQNVRKQAIGDASNVSRFGLILGTLGHQGSTKVMEHFQVLYA